MPRSLDPATPLELVLECDRQKPQPPAFLFQAMTARQWLAFTREYDALFEATTTRDQVEEAFELLRKYLVGWVYIDRPFDPSQLEDVLVAEEAFELAGLLYRAGRLGHDDKKKSESPPSSNSDSSAATAAAASASTPPPS